MFDKVDPLAVAMLTFAVIGVVKFFTSLLEKDFKTAVKIAVAGVTGAIFAPFAGEITWFVGMLIGFSGSGVITSASYVGSRAVNPSLEISGVDISELKD